MPSLLVGYGYLGSRVGQRWLAAGEEVFVLTRSSEKAESLARLGYQPIVADIANRDALPKLPPVETVLFAVGYDRSINGSIEEVYVGGLRNTLDRLTLPARIVYISTTGVYGPGGAGAWVDETSPCHPTRPGAQASFAAEALLAEHRWGANRVALRMAGLYGPGRLPLAASLRAGEPIPADPEAYLNLIHIDDAAQVAVWAARAKAAAPVYCVSDGNPTPRREFYAELARLLTSPAPVFARQQADPTGARRGGDKRVSNARLLADMPVKLAYASFREGLASVARGMESQ